MCDCISIFLARADWAAIGTMIIAAFTICLWWSTKKLWESTNIAAKATENAANAAKDSADVAKKSAEVIPAIERAYLYVSSVNIETESWMHAKSNQILPIKVKVSNYGRTPAKVKEIIAIITIGKPDGLVVKQEIFDNNKEISDAAGRFIARDAAEVFYRPVNDILRLINEGFEKGYPVSLIGEVRYQDIFKKDQTAFFDWYFVSIHGGFYIINPDGNYTT
ncbi:MAG: hypothetical protein ACLQBQ_03080 [Smithella sp.]